MLDTMPPAPKGCRDRGPAAVPSIRDVRLKRGWTQQELAERLGTVQPTVSHLETGTSLVSVDFLARLAGVLGASDADVGVWVRELAAAQRAAREAGVRMASGDRYASRATP